MLKRLTVAASLTILSVFLLGFRVGSHPLVCVFVDNDADPLENVEIQLTFLDAEDLDAEDEEAPQEHYAMSDKKGRIEFRDLQPGSYMLRAQLEGYLPLKVMIESPAAEPLHRVLLKEKEFEDLEKRAVESLKNGDFEAAIQGLGPLSNHYPEDATLHNNLARAYAGVPDEKKALAEAERAAELDPGFSSTKNEVRQFMLHTLGAKALRERDFKTAVERFNALKELHPQSAAAHEGLALAFGHQGKLDQALQAIGRALELDPDNPSFKRIKEILEVNAGTREP